MAQTPPKRVSVTVRCKLKAAVHTRFLNVNFEHKEAYNIFTDTSKNLAKFTESLHFVFFVSVRQSTPSK